jgi:DNA-binding response OmpR family regulator
MMTKGKVLLADPSEFCLELLKGFLKQSKVQIFTASDGPGAIRRAGKLRPDLVVLERGLPEIDGLECCRAIKADQHLAAVPVIVLLPAGQGGERAACLAAGCDAVVEKPLNRKDFLEAGRAFLGRIERREPRILCRASVACRFDQETFFGTIEDISPQGMYVGSNRQVQNGETLRARFLLPWQEGRLIEADARVTWTQGARGLRKNKLPQGFGIAFENPDLDDMQAIRSFIEHSLLRLHHLQD